MKSAPAPGRSFADPRMHIGMAARSAPPARAATSSEQQHGRPLVVEVIGPAGAGKSSLIRELCARDTAFHRGPSLRRVDTPLIVRRAPRWLPVMARLGVTAPRLARQFGRHLVRVEVLDALLARHTRPDGSVVMFDEGPIFSMALMLAFDQHEGEASPVARQVMRAADRWASILDVVVWLDAGDAALTSRIRTRVKAHRMKAAGADETREFLDRYRRAYDAVGTRLAASGRVRMLRVDTTATPLADMATDVMSMITRVRDAR